MIICGRCSGKGFVGGATAFGVPSKCLRCFGEGRIHREDLRTGDHCLQIYRNAQEQLETIASFVSDGIRRAEYIVCIIDEAKISPLEQILAVQGIDRKDFQKQIAIISADHFYLPLNRFEPKDIFKGFAKMKQESLNFGFHSLRVVGEFPSRLPRLVPAEDAILYESLVQDQFNQMNMPILALCQYHSDSFSHEVLDCLTHSHNMAMAV